VWSAIGSSNFDYRSVLYNDEVEAIVLGAETASELETVFTEGMAIATEIDSETWEEDRPLDDRMKGFFSRMWEHLL
jgi:cardiolipin synthase